METLLLRPNQMFEPCKTRSSICTLPNSRQLRVVSSGAAVWVRRCMHHAVMNHTFIAIACVCEGMERAEEGGGGMTNSGQLKPLGLNTIVVAERGHYWKWLCHRGRPCWIAFSPSPRLAMISLCFPPAHMHTQIHTHTDALKWRGICNNPWELSRCQHTHSSVNQGAAGDGAKGWGAGHNGDAVQWVCITIMADHLQEVC